MNQGGMLIPGMLRVSRYTVAVPVDRDPFALISAASGGVGILSYAVPELLPSQELAGVDASSTAMGDLIASVRIRGYLKHDSPEEELRAVRRQSSPAVHDNGLHREHN